MPNEDKIGLTGPMQEIVIQVGQNEEGPFVHIAGKQYEPPTVIGAEPKVTDIPDLLAFATVSQALASVFGCLHERENKMIQPARVPMIRA